MTKNWIPKDLKKGSLTAIARREGGIGPDGKIKMSWLKEKASGNGAVARKARLAIAFKHMKKK